MQITKVPLKKIKIEDRFREDMGDLDELALSIQTKGLIQPVTVDAEFNLLAGGRRLAACERAGIKEIPCVIRETEGELDAKEIELFENIHRKDMTWHERSNLTARIHELMVDKHCDTYGQDRWKKTDTARLLGKSPAAVTLDVEMANMMEILPELKDEKNASTARRRYTRLIENKAVEEALEKAKKSGKANQVIWAADHYKVGDALTGMEKQIQIIKDGGRGADFAEVDPPYAIKLDELVKDGNREGIEEYEEISADDYPSFLQYATALVYKTLGTNSFCIWWHGPSWHHEVRNALLNAGFKVDPIPAIWYKQGTPGVSHAPTIHLARTYEPFFIARKGTPTLRTPGRSNVFSYKGVSSAGRIHATERPVDLMREILTTFTHPNSTIISPFLGSGNTIIAAYKEAMHCYGWDLSQEMKDHFLTRVQKEFPDDWEPPF